MEQETKATKEDELLSLLIVKDRFEKWADNADEKDTALLRKQFAELTGLPPESNYITGLIVFSAGFESALNFVNELEQKEEDGSHEGN